MVSSISSASSNSLRKKIHNVVYNYLFIIYCGLICPPNVPGQILKSISTSGKQWPHWNLFLILLFIKFRSVIYGCPCMVVRLWLFIYGCHRLEINFGHLIFYFFYLKTNGNFIILRKFTTVTPLSLMAQFLRHVNQNFTSFLVIFLVLLIAHFQFLKILVSGIDARFTAKFYF